MGRVAIISTAAAAVCAAFAISSPGAARSDYSFHSFDRELLEAHNRERLRVGVERLEWDVQLAKDAQEWANHLAKTGRFDHADWETRKHAGENLWMGTPRSFSGSDMIGRFIAERRFYRHRAMPDVSTTGDWTDVGHYTQLVWRDTEKVGCGIATGRRGEVLVCRYFPAGNHTGKLAY